MSHFDHHILFSQSYWTFCMCTWNCCPPCHYGVTAPLRTPLMSSVMSLPPLCPSSVEAVTHGGLHPSEERLKASYVSTPCEVCPSLKLLQMFLLLSQSEAPPDVSSSPVSGRCTATILHGLTCPKILCVPKKEERKTENGDIAWRRSSLSLAWAAEIVT